MHERIFELLEQNMKALYDETSSWDPWLKRDELLHPKSRFLLAFEDHENTLTFQRVAQRRSGRFCEKPQTQHTLQGFVMWRFDTDDTVPEDPYSLQGESDVEVAYWYVEMLEMMIQKADSLLIVTRCKWHVNGKVAM